MTHGSLFSGIGGFDLAAEWMGWKNLFHCEWNPFGQKVLKYYWPEAESFNDITKTDFSKYANRVSILTGGFPCQPYSLAGKRKGKEDDRHLWPQMCRAIREIKPRWVVGENVLGLVNWNGGLVFHEVQSDLEAEGYEVWPYVLPAAAVNAPHRRDRVWFVAHSNSNGLNQCHGTNEINPSEGRINALGNVIQSNGNGLITNSQYNRCNTTGKNRNLPKKERKKSERRDKPSFSFENGNFNEYSKRWWQSFPTVAPICDGNDGFSDRLDGITFSKWRNESIKAGGNAIVPQVALQIFKTIEQYENLNLGTGETEHQ